MNRRDLLSLRSFIGYLDAHEQRRLTAGESKECKRLIRALNTAIKGEPMKTAWQ